MANKLDQGIQKIPGVGSSIDDFKTKYLDPLNIVGDPGDVMNLGGSGYDKAIAGAQAAQQQANALSALQWQRQMTGLNGALGYVNNMQSLYNSLYGRGSGPAGRIAPGGSIVPGPDPNAQAAPPPIPVK